jgi:hypothetical protein
MVLILRVFTQTLFGNYINLILIVVDDEICMKFSSQDSGQKKRLRCIEALLNKSLLRPTIIVMWLLQPFLPWHCFTWMSCEFLSLVEGSVLWKVGITCHICLYLMEAFMKWPNQVSRNSKSRKIHHSWELHMLLFLFFLLARKVLCYL